MYLQTVAAFNIVIYKILVPTHSLMYYFPKLIFRKVKCPDFRVDYVQDYLNIPPWAHHDIH